MGLDGWLRPEPVSAEMVQNEMIEALNAVDPASIDPTPQAMDANGPNDPGQPLEEIVQQAYDPMDPNMMLGMGMMPGMAMMMDPMGPGMMAPPGALGPGVMPGPDAMP